MEIVPQLVINSIIAGSLYGLVALGFNLLYRTTKFFNLAHGALAVVGGYTAFFLLELFNRAINGVVIAVAGALGAGFVGYLLYYIVFLPLRRRKASVMVLLVASLGLFTAIEAFIAILFSNRFQTLSGAVSTPSIYKIPFPWGAPATITPIQTATVVTVMAVALALAWLLRFTVFGKAVRAIGDDEEVARIVGINTDRVIGAVFFIASAIAGLAGVLVGFDTGIEPVMGMGLLLKGVIASIVGGVGNIYGGVLGSFLLGFVENFGIWKISGEWKDAIAFALLIIFLLFKPRGIITK